MIYLLRHGLDDESYIGGWSDVDLINEGIEQIKNSTRFISLKKLNIKNIISSDIKRAVSTTNIVNNELCVDVIYTVCLRELDKGDFTGILKSNVNYNVLEQIKKFDIYDRYPNGESMIELYNRIKIYLNKLKKMDNVLLVTHRGVINMFYYILNDIELDMDKNKFNVSHGSVHEMDIERKLIRRIY